MEITGKKDTVDIADPVAFEREWAFGRAGNRNIHYKQPVSDKNSGGYGGTYTCAECDKQQGCKHPAEAYAGKDTGKTEVGEVEVKQSVVEDAEKNEY